MSESTPTTRSLTERIDALVDAAHLADRPAMTTLTRMPAANDAFTAAVDAVSMAWYAVKDAGFVGAGEYHAASIAYAAAVAAQRVAFDAMTAAQDAHAAGGEW